MALQKSLCSIERKAYVLLVNKRRCRNVNFCAIAFWYALGILLDIENNMKNLMFKAEIGPLQPPTTWKQQEFGQMVETPIIRYIHKFFSLIHFLEDFLSREN